MPSHLLGCAWGTSRIGALLHLVPSCSGTSVHMTAPCLHGPRTVVELLMANGRGPNSPPPLPPGGVAEGSLGTPAPGGAAGLSGPPAQITERPVSQANHHVGVLTDGIARGAARGRPSARRTPEGMCHVRAFNVASLHGGRLQELLKLATQQDVHLLALQGTKWPSEGAFRMHGWEVIAGGATGPADGVVLAVRGASMIRSRTHLLGRIQEVSFTRHGHHLVVFNCYAPGTHRSDAERQVFWSHLRRALQPIARRYHVVVAGDFNAHVGSGRGNAWVGEAGCHTAWNSNGEELFDMATSLGYRVLNTHGSNAATTWTWQSPTGAARRRLDYIMVRGTHAKDAQHVGPRSDTGMEASYGQVDHRPVDAVLPLPRLHRMGPPQRRHHDANRHLMASDYRALENYNRFVRHGGQGPPTPEVLRASRYRHLVEGDPLRGKAVDEALASAATRVYPPVSAPQKSWITDTTWQLVLHRRTAWHAYRDPRRSRVPSLRNLWQAWKAHCAWRKAHQAAQRALRADKRAHLETQAQVAAEAADRGDHRTTYAVIRQLIPTPFRAFRGLRTPSGALARTTAEECDFWRHHMLDTFGAWEGSPHWEPLPPCMGPPLLTTMDVLSALRKRKLGKAGPSGAPCIEAVRLAEAALAPHLNVMWNHIASQGTMPLEWRTSQLVWIPKPGKPADNPEHLRGIHLIHPIGAAYCTALQRRARHELRHLWGPTEHGALPRRSTKDPLAVIRMLMARAQLCKQSFVCYFGDLRKAFDKVARSQVLQTFRDLLPAGPLQRALVDRHVGLGTSIAVDSEAIFFCPPHGVAQGDALGPLAFVATYHRYCHQLDAVRNGFVHPGTHGLVCAPYGVEVPLHRTLFVDDHAEFWPIQHEHEAKRLLGDID